MRTWIVRWFDGTTRILTEERFGVDIVVNTGLLTPGLCQRSIEYLRWWVTTNLGGCVEEERSE